MAVIASAVATVVSVLSARRLATGWRRGRARPSMLAWSIALGMLAVASAALLVGAATTLNQPLFRLFHLFGVVLCPPWLALGSVLATSQDRLTVRLTGAATLLVGLSFLPGALRGDSVALVGAILGVSWALVQLDGAAPRVRVGSSLVVVAYTLLTVTLVLPAPFTADLPDSGLPDASRVLPAFVRSFAVGGNAVGAVVAIVGGLVAAGRLVRQHASATAGVRSGWRALGRVGRRPLVMGHLSIVGGVAIVAGSGVVWTSIEGIAARAVGIGLGVIVLQFGFDRTTGRLGPDRSAEVLS